MEKTRIVIAQTLCESLWDIKDKLKDDSKLDIVYTSSSVEALQYAVKPETKLLITGQLFYGLPGESYLEKREDIVLGIINPEKGMNDL